jgi:hypothetical protein
MQRFFRSCSFLLLTGLLLAGTAQAQRTKSINERIPLSPRGEVIVDTYKGSITVDTWDRDEVDIEIIVEADRDEELVADTEVHIRRSGDRVSLETDYEAAKRLHERRWGDDYNLPFVHYRITMPRTAGLRVDDYKSEIHIADLRADLDLETYKGIVDIRNLDGALRLETYKGDVTVDFSDLAGPSSFETYKGTIGIRLPRDAGFDLDADVGRKGDLDADFRASNYRDSDETYRGEINGGGPRLSLDTFKGTYRLYTR